MSGALSIALLTALAAGRPAPPPRQPRPLVAAPRPLANDFPVTVTPSTISFDATNPATNPAVQGSATAVVQWTLGSGNKWMIQVQAATPTFTNCPQIPVSAVTVTCTSIGNGGTASCAAPFPLSTTPLTLANGSKGGPNYTVNINYILSDSWKYLVASSCSLSLTYNVQFP